MIKKLALFPTTKDTCAIARFSSSFVDYELFALFSPSFYQLGGTDISRFDGGSFASLTIEDYSSKKLIGCDSLYVDYEESVSDLKIYRDVINHAKKENIEIILSLQLSKKLEKKSFESIEITNDLSLYDISAPVISILPQGPYTDQLATELAVRQYFVENGYKVTQIGSCEASLFFGFSATPSFLHNPGDACDKIIAFNHYVYELVEKEQPDLLIMSSYDAIMKYNNKIINGLGILPYIMCSAVRPDAIVVCLYHTIYQKKLLEELSLYCQYHLGCPTTLFNIANVSVTADGVEKNKLSYVTLESTFVLQGILHKMDVDDHHLFNALTEESALQASMKLEKLLSDNVQNLK